MDSGKRNVVQAIIIILYLMSNLDSCEAQANCTTDAQCPNQYCDPVPGMCANKKPVNQPCVRPIECVAGNCASGMCALQVDNGPCTQNTDCASGSCGPALVCVKVLVPDNSPCVNDNDCISNHCNINPALPGGVRKCTYCENTFWSTTKNDCILPPGRTCAMASQCETGQCDLVANICPKRNVGQSCGTNNTFCLTDYCLGTVCTLLEDGKMCTNNIYCNSTRCHSTAKVCIFCEEQYYIGGRCQVPHGSACTLDIHCATNNCKLGLCQYCNSSDWSFVNSKCEIGNGGSCEINTHCMTNNCNAQTCTYCNVTFFAGGRCVLPTGSTCEASTNCDSINCQNNICQFCDPSDWINGTCQIPNGKRCTEGSHCASGNCNSAICTYCTAQYWINNRCQIPNKMPCEDNTNCKDMKCNDNICTICDTQNWDSVRRRCNSQNFHPCVDHEDCDSLNCPASNRCEPCTEVFCGCNNATHEKNAQFACLPTHQLGDNCANLTLYCSRNQLLSCVQDRCVCDHTQILQEPLANCPVFDDDIPVGNGTRCGSYANGLRCLQPWDCRSRFCNLQDPTLAGIGACAYPELRITWPGCQKITDYEE